MSENRKVELYRDEQGQFRWRRWTSSDIVATSGEGYADHEHAAVQAATEADAFEAELVDLTKDDE